MKKAILLTLVLVAACAGAQVQPAATGPAGPPVNGSLQYSVRYSQIAVFYGDNQVPGGNEVDSTASADVAYANPSARRPFRLEYGGGYIASNSDAGLGEGFYQHLLLSQGFAQRHWSVIASDEVSYTPQAPSVGFSGVPGTGEPVGGSGTTPPSGQSILTLNTHVLSNRADMTLNDSLTSATSFSLGGGMELLRYPDGNGLDSDGQDVRGEITRRLTARNSLSAIASYSHFRYDASLYSGGAAGGFGTPAVFGSFHRVWSRRLTMDLSAGPQWTTGSDRAVVPPTTTLAANAGLTYQVRSVYASLTFDRGIDGGAGYLPGAIVDIVQGNLSRPFQRNLLFSVMGAYLRTSALQQASGTTQARYGSVQGSRRFGRYLSLFASYTAIDQTTGLPSSLPQSNLLHHPYQVISFGLAFSPREVRLQK